MVGEAEAPMKLPAPKASLGSAAIFAAALFVGAALLLICCFEQ